MALSSRQKPPIDTLGYRKVEKMEAKHISRYLKLRPVLEFCKFLFTEMELLLHSKVSWHPGTEPTKTL